MVVQLYTSEWILTIQRVTMTDPTRLAKDAKKPIQRINWRYVAVYGSFLTVGGVAGVIDHVYFSGDMGPALILEILMCVVGAVFKPDLVDDLIG